MPNSENGFVPILILIIAGILISLSFVSFKLATSDDSKVAGVSIVRRDHPTAIPEASDAAETNLR